MEKDQAQTKNQAHGGVAGRLGGEGLSQAGDGIGGNDLLQPDAGFQAARDPNWTSKKEVALPVLAEMGDISPALELLLRVQADYARREPGVSRAMRDVALSAVATEIERYLQRASRQFHRR